MAVMPPGKPQEIQTSPAFRDTGTGGVEINPSLNKSQRFFFGFREMLFFGGVYPPTFFHGKYKKPRSKQQKTSGDIALNDFFYLAMPQSRLHHLRMSFCLQDPHSYEQTWDFWTMSYWVQGGRSGNEKFIYVFYVFTNEILLSYGYLSLYHGKLGTYNLHF